jgi:tetratricopeptide (TPR) repeat protein
LEEPRRELIITSKIDRAVQTIPSSALIYEHLKRGIEFHRNGELLRAEGIYREILADVSGHFEALYFLGVILIQTGRLEGGIELIDRALTIRPDYAEALLNRGGALRELKRLDEALASYDRALAIRPDYAEALYNRGAALQKLRRFDEALASYDRALAIRPDYADALCGRGGALRDLRRFDEALASYDRALAIRPDYAEALCGRGGALRELKRLGEEVASYDRALAIRPDYAEALFARGSASLQLGDFEKGWIGYENRWERKKAPEGRLKAEYPVWKGESISRKRVIVYEEQGLGDTIQFSRYLRELSDLQAQVTFLVRPSLHRLLRTLGRAVQFVGTEPVGESFDYQCALLSLPLAFGTTLESIPAEIPYLRAEPKRVAKWRERLGGRGFKIGVAWQGSKAAKIDIGRSFALAEFLGVSRLPNIRLISLQKGEGVDHLCDLPEGMAVETLGGDYDGDEGAFLDTAAVMETLDLVISSDTSIAHLAGALGRPTWVALKHVPDWRWMLDGAESPWYPTMRLFRQRTMDDWTGVFSEIADALRELVGDKRVSDPSHSASAPIAPISWGELIDKITILEIKIVEIASEAARANVTKELTLLQKLASTRASDQLLDLRSKLKAVNVALWKIEDAIREKDRKNELDEEFIELARSVYRRNDERAAIKRMINTVLCGYRRSRPRIPIGSRPLIPI